MSDLLNKLNVLLRASLNNTLGGANPPSHTDWTNVSPQEVEGQLRVLHQQIEAALNAEDAMQRRLEDSDRQSAALDAQIDSALVAGDDANARTLTAQLQRQKQQTAILQAELEDHRRSTSALIEQVNQLEAIVSEAQARRSSSESHVGLTPPEDVLNGPRAASVESSRPAASVRVPINVGRPANPPPSEPKPAPKSDDSDEELAQRRARLSGPDKPTT